MINSYAQNNEDVFIHKFFERNTGYFVDVGAHDGVQFSNTYALEKLGWRGVCVEPNANSFEALIQNRPRSVCIQVACGKEALDNVTLYIPAGFPVLGTLRTGMDDEILRILQRPGDLNYQTMIVQQMTLDSVLEQVSAPLGFDLLNIDTEFTEADVIAGIQLDVWRPQMLMIEVNNQFEFERVKDAIFIQCHHRVGYSYCGHIAVNHVWLRSDLDTGKAKGLLACHQLR